MNERIERLEESIELLVSIANTQTTILQGQQKTLDEHTQLLHEHTQLLRAHQVLIGKINDNLEEVRRDTQQTQRLWVKLAQKNGWLDDEDLS